MYNRLLYSLFIPVQRLINLNDIFTNSGGYLYTKMINATDSLRAAVISEPLHSNEQDHCLIFWYLANATGGALSVYGFSSGGAPHLAWRRAGIFTEGLH